MLEFFFRIIYDQIWLAPCRYDCRWIACNTIEHCRAFNKWELWVQFSLGFFASDYTWSFLLLFSPLLSLIKICLTSSYIMYTSGTSFHYDGNVGKVSFIGQCTKMQLITSQNFNIQSCFSQFLWFFGLKCWFKSQIISRNH